MPAATSAIDGSYHAGAAEIGSGKVRLLTLDDLDRRTAAARRARDLVADIEGDLGGRDHLSAAERQLVQRAAVLGAIIESEEVRWLSGEKIAVELHLSAINAQRRVLADLGLQRRQRNVTPTLEQYIAGRAAEKSGAIDGGGAQ